MGFNGLSGILFSYATALKLFASSNPTFIFLLCFQAGFCESKSSWNGGYVPASSDLSRRKQWHHYHLFSSCTVPAAGEESYVMGRTNELEDDEDNFRVRQTCFGPDVIQVLLCVDLNADFSLAQLLFSVLLCCTL